MKKYALICLLAALCRCGTDNGRGVFQSSDAGAVAGCDIQPQFTSLFTRLSSMTTCNISGCHFPPVNAKLDFSLSQSQVYSELVNVASVCDGTVSDCKLSVVKTLYPLRVMPGSPAQSFLYVKIALDSSHIANGQGGSQMPIGGQLQACEIEAFSAWISAGAANN